MNKHENFEPEFLHNDKTLISQLYNEIIGYLMKMKKNYRLPNDIVYDISQSTLLTCLINSKRNKFKHKSTINTYAIGVAKRLLLRYLRDNRNTISIEETDILFKMAIEEPYNHYEVELKWNVFFKEYRKLTDECRNIIRLAIKKLGSVKIKKRMGYKSESFVNNKMYRCKKHFVKLVKDNPNYQKYIGYDREDYEIFERGDE